MKYKKILSVFILFIIMFATTSNADPGGAGGGLSMDSLWEDTNFKSVNQGVTSTEGFIGGINTIIGLIQVAGTGILVIMITFLGIKYIMASIEEKAEIKKTALPIVIGAVLLFGALEIVKAISDVGDTLNPTGTTP